MHLDRLTWRDLAAARGKTFVVPLGSLEQHGYHLPMGVDTAIITEIARRAEQRLPDELVLTPAQWLGHSPHHAHFGCASLNLRPYMDLIAGLCRSLAAMGAGRIFLLNGHGGNDVPCRAALSELKAEWRDRGPLIAFANYWSLAAAAFAGIRTSPRGGMGHACEMETSIMQVIDPAGVRLAEAVDDGTFRESGYRIGDMLRPQPYFLVRDFHEFGESGTHGMPSHASPAKGEQFLEAAVDAVVHFLADFANWG